MKEIIFIIEESLEGGYEARALEAHIHTEANNLVELKKVIRDAVKCHYKENEMPQIIRLHFSKEEIISI